MSESSMTRKDLDNQEFLKLRQATAKIGSELENRLRRHLETLRPLFIPRKLLGTYLKSSVQQEIHGSEKAFAELQEMFATVCQNPFELPKKLQTPLAPISTALDFTPLEYTLDVKDAPGGRITITSPTKYLLCYQSECSLKRLQNMLDGREARQTDEMRQALLSHMVLVISLETFPALKGLLEDLRYRVEIIRLKQFGNLPVVLLTAPLTTFLPNDQFIQEVTQLSGIPAFQEIIDFDEIESMADPLKELFVGAAKSN